MTVILVKCVIEKIDSDNNIFVIIMTMQFILFSDEKAKKHVKRIIRNKPELQCLFVDRWLEETRSVKCYLLVDEKKLFSIALLSKMDFDPENIHSEPFMLEYIYTFPEYRRQHFAYNILSYLKKKEQMSACCTNKESGKLFETAEFSFAGYCGPTEIYRYP